MKTTVGTLFIAFVVKVMWLMLLTGGAMFCLKAILEMLGVDIVITISGIFYTTMFLIICKFIKTEL